MGQDLYAKEMRVWFEQQSTRIADCRNNVVLLQKQVSIHKALIKLERQQIRLIEKRNAHAKKELNAYLAEKLRKSDK